MPQTFAAPFISTFLDVSRGLSAVEDDEEWDFTQGGLDAWSDDWMRGRGTRATRTVTLARTPGRDDGDPGHEQADERARAAGVDTGTADLLSIARSQIGSPYIWADANPVGGEGGPGSGFDCSGLTQWVLSRFGIDTVHMASEQQKQFRRVGRGQLRPGDLVFYNYGRKAPGVADHVAIYIGNGKQIAASSGTGEVAEQTVDWQHFIGGGATGINANDSATRGAGQRPRRPNVEVLEPEQQAFTLVNAGLEGGPSMAPVMASLLSRPLEPEAPRNRNPQGARRGAGSVKGQLYQGFIDAGRPDLAKMVYTKDFDTWINAESGWNVDSVSRSFPGHGRNYGLFQFWEGHPWTDEFLNGPTTWTANAYRQAQLVAKYFPHLSPGSIREYAQEIRAGQYSGWG